MTDKVLIAGGGIGGLAAALALIKQGIDVEIYEQAQEFREVGAGIQISPNGNRALDALGVFHALKALSCDADEKLIRLWNSGATWKLFDLGTEAVQRYGYPYLTVYRPDLLKVLADAVRTFRPGALHLETRCAGVTQEADRVILHLEDGRSISGAALIGADGVHSRIRAALWGESRPLFSGMMAWRGVIPVDRLPAGFSRPVATNWIGPGAHVVCYPLRGGQLFNFVATVHRADWQIESWSTEGTHEECAADFAGWHPDIHTMIANAPRLFKWALMGREPMAAWTRGRATLLGDACHPTLPFLAQGAVMALEDAVILGRCFAAEGRDYPAALQRYERARIDITRRKVQGASANTERFHNPALADEVSAKAYVDREWSRAAILDRYEWIFTYDAPRVEI